jgi:hypothetical protein
MFKKPEFSMRNVKPQRKYSQISHGTPRGQACGHGLFDSCRELSTNRPVILQNKANFRKSQMDVRLNISRDYEEKSKWTLGENKPNFKAEDRRQNTEDSRSTLSATLKTGLLTTGRSVLRAPYGANFR